MLASKVFLKKTMLSKRHIITYRLICDIVTTNIPLNAFAVIFSVKIPVAINYNKYGWVILENIHYSFNVRFSGESVEDSSKEY